MDHGLMQISAHCVTAESVLMTAVSNFIVLLLPDMAVKAKRGQPAIE